MKPKIKPYTAPAGGWGSAKSVANILLKEGALISGTRLLTHQNKPQGFAESNIGFDQNDGLVKQVFRGHNNCGNTPLLFARIGFVEDNGWKPTSISPKWNRGLSGRRKQ